MKAWLLVCGIVAPIQVVFFILAAALATPGYSHLSDTVSVLGAQGQPYAWFIGTGLVIYGLLICACARGLYLAVAPGRAAAWLWLSMTVHGVSVLCAGVLQDYTADHPDPLTFAGDLHGYLAYAAFVGLLAAMFFSGIVTRKRDGWNSHSPLTIAAALVSIAIVSLFFLEPLHPAQGLIQRGFYVLPMVWLALTSLHAYALTSGSERKAVFALSGGAPMGREELAGGTKQPMTSQDGHERPDRKPRRR
ncbi:MAG: DUF998 domain-containing protein [Dehalococcoidia bacterium]